MYTPADRIISIVMSNLYQSLGPQGRALLSQNGPGIPSTLLGTPNTNLSPQELDFLINELRNPKPDTTINKVLGYLYIITLISDMNIIYDLL